MALEYNRVESSRYAGRSSVLLLLIWTSWLICMRSISLPYWLTSDGAAFLLLIGASWWGIVEGSGYLLIAAFIWGSFSLMPSGLCWVSLLGVFLALRLTISRITISARWQLALVIFLISVGLHLFQALLIHEVSGDSAMSFKILGRILSIGLCQSLISYLFAKPILGMFEAR